MGGNGSDRLVPVLDLDGGEGDVDDVAIGPVTGHLYPVPFRQHPVRRELDAGDKAENGVLEDKHEHRGENTHTAEQEDRRLAEKGGQNDDDRGDVENDLGHLDEALEWYLLGDGEGAVDLEYGIEQRVEGEETDDDHVDQGGAADPSDQLLGAAKRDGCEEEENDARGEVGEPEEDVVPEQAVVPIRLGSFDDGRGDLEQQTLGDKEGRSRQEDEKEQE